jgi:hypothetical protein
MGKAAKRAANSIVVLSIGSEVIFWSIENHYRLTVGDNLYQVFWELLDSVICKQLFNLQICHDAIIKTCVIVERG